MKNKMRIIVPAAIVLIGILGYSIAATTLQTWQTQSGSRVASIDSNGALDINGVLSTSTSANTPAITSSGSVSFAEPFAGTTYKKAILGCTSLVTTAATSYSFATPFTYTPVLSNSTAQTGTFGAVTLSTTGISLATTGTAAATGVIIVEGQ